MLPTNGVEIKLIIERKTSDTVGIDATEIAAVAINKTLGISGDNSGSSIVLPIITMELGNGGEIIISNNRKTISIMGNLYKYIAPIGKDIKFMENPKDFTDNTIAWAKPSIDYATERELFLGTNEYTFNPNEEMTRGMFVTVIGRLYEGSYENISGTSTFLDIDESSYYAKYVAWADENDIVKGVGGNEFAPNEMVTREQMAVIILNFAKLLNKEDISSNSLSYADSTSISSWAVDGAKYCQETKIIRGREGGNFVPKGNVTRAEVAAVIEKFIKVILQ